MPIYQYKCTECNELVEALQRMSDPLLTDCPACGASALVKQLTAAAFKLKGTGWYETDFKTSGSKTDKATQASEPKQADSSKTANSSTASNEAASSNESASIT